MNHILRAAMFNALLLAGASIVLPDQVQAQPATLSYQVRAGDLDAALKQFASQSRIQLIYDAPLVEGRRSPGLTGSYRPEEALRQLLHGQGLSWEFVDDATVVIRKSQPAAAQETHPSASTRTQPAPRAEPAITDMQSMTVTGTRIRGGQSPSPVITIGAENIREEGFADLGEVIRSISQNFSGGQNPGVLSAIGSGSVYNQNATGGSSLNLRGIGADATLTLLNGRRLAYGGFGQAVDISAIPLEAVERIEVVADGASAIYGSDAVAGVGNVILKRDFEGLALGVRYGGTTDGGLDTREYSVTAGASWTSGGLIATYKHAAVDPIRSDQRPYTEHMNRPFVIYPGNGLHSSLVSVHQSLGDRVELRLDALRTERDQKVYYQNFTSSWYENRGETTTSMVAPSVEFLLPAGWSVLLGGAWGKDDKLGRSWMVTAATGQSQFAASSCYCNESLSYEVGVEGPLFALGGGEARLAMGAGYRTSEFINENLLTGSRVIGDEGSRFAYAEMNLPLAGSGPDDAAEQRFTLTAAVRGEDYDSFGRVTTPKFGLIYGPSADVTLKASWGKSFKAPLLGERHGYRYAYLLPPSMVGGSGYPDGAAILMSWGGNPDLNPERARTVTASLVFHPEALPGLEAELTWFDIDYSERVVQPLTAVGQILSNPVLGQFVDYSPTPEKQAELIATYSYRFFNQTGASYDPSSVVAIARGEYINAMRQKIKGVDLSGSYRFDLDNGRLLIRGSASWLNSSQQNSAGHGAFDLAGRIFYPAKVNGRAGAVWTRDGFALSAFANYAQGVTDHLASRKTASFTTLDATLRYMLDEGGRAWSGLEFALSAQNLFNRAPPLYTPAVITDIPYDSTNYSAIGRFVSVSISKYW